jgi:predicted RNase H-like HicB family nuclease
MPFESMSERRKFTVSLVKDPDSGWFAARCVELPEAISQGHTEAEALKNIREAVELVLDEHRQTVTKAHGKLIELTVNA